MCDFQTIGGGYDAKDLWEKLLILKTAEGKTSGTKITYRYYVQDAAFAVSIEVPQKLAESMAEALQHPVWELFLGRKNCAPTDLIYRGMFDTEEAAHSHAAGIAEAKQRTEYFRVVPSTGRTEVDETLTLNDVPLQFGTNKRYKERIVDLVFSRGAQTINNV